MKAPDKIYIPTVYSSTNPGEYTGGIPYIRKDALLEWLREKESLAGALKKEAYQAVIDKLNSL